MWDQNLPSMKSRSQGPRQKIDLPISAGPALNNDDIDLGYVHTRTKNVFANDRCSPRFNIICFVSDISDCLLSRRKQKWVLSLLVDRCKDEDDNPVFKREDPSR
jgi:hypothetical protein